MSTSLVDDRPNLILGVKSLDPTVFAYIVMLLLPEVFGTIALDIPPVPIITPVGKGRLLVVELNKPI
jgi:hypothetical protein